MFWMTRKMVLSLSKTSSLDPLRAGGTTMFEKGELSSECLSVVLGVLHLPCRLKNHDFFFLRRSNLWCHLNLGRSLLPKGGWSCDPWRGKEIVRSHRICCKLGPPAWSLDFVLPVLPTAGSYLSFTKATFLLDLVLQTLEQPPYLFWVLFLLNHYVLHWWLSLWMWKWSINLKNI